MEYKVTNKGLRTQKATDYPIGSTVNVEDRYIIYIEGKHLWESRVERYDNFRRLDMFYSGIRGISCPRYIQVFLSTVRR